MKAPHDIAGVPHHTLAEGLTMGQLERDVQRAYNIARQRLSDCRNDVQELQRREERARVASEQALADMQRAQSAAGAIGLELVEEELCGTPHGGLACQWDV